MSFEASSEVTETDAPALYIRFVGAALAEAGRPDIIVTAHPSQPTEFRWFSSDLRDPETRGIVRRARWLAHEAGFTCPPASCDACYTAAGRTPASLPIFTCDHEVVWA